MKTTVNNSYNIPAAIFGTKMGTVIPLLFPSIIPFFDYSLVKASLSISCIVLLKLDSMNSYLLLRDNKQTGPYSAEEIIAKGFKPYDLVWLEGKSAGWRYPGELPELAPNAPLIEEQPFDRFYKRPANTTTNQEKKAAPVSLTKKPEETVVEEKTAIVKEITESPLIPFPQEKVVRPRKIFVTLPGNAAPVSNSAPVTSPIQKETPKKDTTVNEKPIIAEAPTEAVSVKTQAVPVTFSPAKEKTPIENILPSPDKIKAVRTLPYGKMIRGAVAVCILLGGVVIGLAISTTGKTEEQKQLDALVQQIHDKRLGAGTSSPAPVPASAVEIGNQDSLTSKNEEPVTTASSVPEKVAAQQVSEKSTSNNSINAVSHPAESEKKAIASETPNQTEKAPSVEKIEKKPEALQKFVSVKASDYKTGVLGGISKLQLTVSNNSLYALESVNVELRYLGPEKNLVNTQIITIPNIGPGQEKTQAIPSSKRGVTVDYSIVKINPAANGSNGPVL